jgi:hypothetical protein
MPSLDGDEGFPGLNLEGASLEDLKKLRKLVSKKIKAASKKKPEINPNQGEATITYEKSHADRGALREPERNPDKDHNHQADGYKSPSFGVRKTNNEEWVTVKRSNWNKFKELAGGVGGLQKPSDKPSAKPSAKNQSNARADQRKQKQSEPTRDQGSAKPRKGTQSDRKGSQRMGGPQKDSQLFQAPQFAIPTVNPALVNPFQFSQFGSNPSNPGLHYPTLYNGFPQQRTYFGY